MSVFRDLVQTPFERKRRKSTNKTRLATSVAAVTVAAALLLGGTFTWQSISQTALNEASDIINSGGRLHDDINGANKDIYVENFADEPILARIRLAEYLELTVNMGTDAERERVVIGSTDPETGSPRYDIRYVHEPDPDASYWNWYAIEVTAQFVTMDDIGKVDHSGFYDTVAGSAPTNPQRGCLSTLLVVCFCRRKRHKNSRAHIVKRPRKFRQNLILYYLFRLRSALYRIHSF